MVKLHLGCGVRDFGPEWFHIDGGYYSHVQARDITKLNFPDETVDQIYASHVIAYFDRHEIKPILKEWKRVLKTGGVLRLAVPDFEVMARLYTMDSKRFPLSSILGPLYGKMGMGDKWIYHKTVYDFPSLARVLHEAGFRIVDRYDWRQTDHAHIDDHSQAYLPHMDKKRGNLISLNVEAIK